MLAAARDELRAFAREGRFFRGVRAQLTQWHAPKQVSSGETVVLRWQTQGARAVHVSLGGVYPFEHRAGAQGELRFVAESAGEVTVRVLMLSEQAEQAGQWIAYAAPAIQVQQSSLSVAVSASRVQALPKTAVKLRWSAIGASEVTVQRLSTGEQMSLPAQGVVSVTMGYAHDVLTFCATAADGRVSQALCELVPELNATYNNGEAKRFSFNLTTMNQALELRL